MADGGKLLHLHPDFRQHGLSGDPRDPGNPCQPLHDVSKGLDNPLNLCVELLDGALQVLDPPQVLR